MSLVNPVPKKSGYKLVGASLPSRLHTYLSLYCLAKHTSRTKILKDLIEEWTTGKESPSNLIKEIVTNINLSWKIEKSSGRVSDYKKFESQVHQELKSKGLGERDISLILKEIKQ